MPESFLIDFLGDKHVQIQKEQTVLEASLAAGIPHYHACGGKGKCSTCRILITEGFEYLSYCNDKESALHKRLPLPRNVRLACQTYVNGELVRVHRMIRDEVDIQMYINEDTLTDLEHIGEERELALFFLDIRDFTPFIAAYLPFDVIHVMRRLFTLFQKCIEERGGKIIETAGDGFYAVFGFKTNITVATNDAYRAGSSILAEIENFNVNYMEKNFRYHFQVGMSLHTGTVIVGNVGIGVNNNMTVMGLPVNIAARLQAATKQLNNNFLVSGVAFKLLDAPGTATKMQINLKGITERVTVYLLGKPYKS